MSQSKVDCHFFLSSTCRNGTSCAFRHSAGARDTEEACPSFAQTGECPQDDCGKRHTEKSAGRAAKPPSAVPCRNEENGGTCARADCIFKHSRPHGGGSGGGAQQQGDGGSAVNRPTRKMAPALGNNSLSARAKVFVPQTKPQIRAKTFGNMEWTPAGAPEPTKRHAWPGPSMA
ncbi:hypothetical protein GGI22_005464, partial [Coemansia erecta]